METVEVVADLFAPLVSHRCPVASVDGWPLFSTVPGAMAHSTTVPAFAQEAAAWLCNVQQR